MLIQVEDVIALRNGVKFIKEARAVIAQQTYENIMGFDVTARAMQTRDSTSTKAIEDWWTVDGPHMTRRKIFMRWYLTNLCNDPTTLEYWTYMDKVG